ncbi:hypothetical protein ACS127_05550 [Amphibacillus sp. Q70]|uniref:hypothetical protein n=1 Tax=Amphibacillus sp. Q70 TaxID=3453416 RepID=UPI003F85A394
MKEKRYIDIKSTGKELVLETFLDVGSKAAADVAKEAVTTATADLLVDSASSLVPGVSGAVQGYKRRRFERNIIQFTKELNSRVDEVRMNLEEKSNEQKEQIDQLFQYVIDYVVDEKQQEKIAYMVNGFVKISEHDHITEDFVLNYYDVLRELRMVDISVLRLMYFNAYILRNISTKETFESILEEYRITQEQYEAVRRNLFRIGLLTTETDLNIIHDLNEISDKFKELYSYLDKFTNPKYNRKLPKLKTPKLKSKERFKISKFGRDFMEFFLDSEDKKEK